MVRSVRRQSYAERISSGRCSPGPATEIHLAATLTRAHGQPRWKFYDGMLAYLLLFALLATARAKWFTIGAKNITRPWEVGKVSQRVGSTLDGVCGRARSIWIPRHKSVDEKAPGSGCMVFGFSDAIVLIGIGGGGRDNTKITLSRSLRSVCCSVSTMSSEGDGQIFPNKHLKRGVVGW